MSLREFLLDYAEKAPKAKRLDEGERIRFLAQMGGFGNWSCCPLELTTHSWFGYARHVYGDDFPQEMIAAAADNGAINRGPDDAERAWRAVLEKLAEPEVRS